MLFYDVTRSLDERCDDRRRRVVLLLDDVVVGARCRHRRQEALLGGPVVDALKTGNASRSRSFLFPVSAPDWI